MDDDWVPVWNSAWLHEAYFVKSLLEADGIAVRIPDEHTVSVHSLLTTAMGGVRVLVRASDHERASEILAQAGDVPPEP